VPLGSGSYGTVYKGIQLGTNKVVAIKFYKLTEFKHDVEYHRQEFFKDSVMREYTMLSKGVPGVCKVYERPIIVDKYKFYLIMEYIEGRTIHHFLSAIHEQKWDIDQAVKISKAILKIMIQILEIIIRLHTYGIDHHDLQTTNIMIRDNDFSIVLIDLGIACFTNKSDEKYECDDSIGLPDRLGLYEVFTAMTRGNSNSTNHELLDSVLYELQAEDTSTSLDDVKTTLESIQITEPFPIFDIFVLK
jgi:serine/threonine protein kinase